MVQALEPAPLPLAEQYAACLESIRGRRQKADLLRNDVERLRQVLARFEVLCQSRVGDLLKELQRVASAGRVAQRRLEAAVAAMESRAEEVLDVLLDGLDVEYDLEPNGAGETPTSASATLGSGSAAAGLGENGAQGPALLKRLYRDLAKRCHPDLAVAATERHRREGLMQRINEAFRDGDIEALRSLLHETAADEPAFLQRTPAEKLQWALEELARLDREVARLRAELVQLHVGELYRLWRRHEAGEAVFEVLEDDLERRIRREGRRLDRLVASHRRVMEQQGTPIRS